jgi:hypothetical protein
MVWCGRVDEQGSRGRETKQRKVLGRKMEQVSVVYTVQCIVQLEV